ncbi:MAG TPA: GntR family transcriptional regulator, partial [Burkholderiaceae bacterium]|nr:GntR family transcriptional regulator [Burkholderiaceae bacterium]
MKRDATVTEDESAAIDTDAAARTRRMYERILSSFAEHRLAPGTRLREERLAELFEVSRTQVRQVLQRLEHEG